MLFLPILLIVASQLLGERKIIQPKSENGQLLIPSTNQHELYDLKTDWQIKTTYNTQTNIQLPKRVNLVGNEQAIFAINLHVNPDKMYALYIPGIKQPYTIQINDTDYENDQIVHFQAPSSDVHVKITVDNYGNQASILEPPIIGSIPAIERYQLSKYTIVLITATALFLFSLYCISMYWLNRRNKQFLFISLYMIFVLLSLVLSKDALGTLLFPFIPSLYLLKLKTFFSLLCIIPVLFILNTEMHRKLSTKFIALISISNLIVSVAIFIAPFHVFKYVELLVWVMLVLFLIYQLLSIFIYKLKMNALILDDLLVLSSFSYLIGYLVVRIYYNIFGTSFQTGILLFIFIAYMVAAILLKGVRIAKERDETKISYYNAQIKPHFIHNAISNIIALCYTEPTKAANLLSKLSTYLRHMFENNKENAFISLKDELNLVEAYVEIEKTRFPHKIHYEQIVDEHCFYKLVPAFSIQPFVENAIRHGIFNQTDGGTVKVTIKEQKNMLSITIEDDGVGIEPEHLQRILNGQVKDQGIAILNVQQRLRYIQHAELTIQSEVTKGTCIHVQIPT